RNGCGSGPARTGCAPLRRTPAPPARPSRAPESRCRPAREFLGELTAQRLAGGVYVVPVDLAVRAGEVDVLEDAHRRLDLGEGMVGVEALVVQHDEFARLDIADGLGADQVEGASLRRHDPGVLDPAQA